MTISMKRFSDSFSGELETLRGEEAESGRPKLQKRYLVVAGVVLAICVAAVGIVQITFQLYSRPKPLLEPPNPETPLPPSNSQERHFKKAAVCSDGPPCAEIGKNIFLKNGSVVDAAVATLICNGMVNSQSMGLGGGFMMTLYLRESQTAITLNARESAPLRSEPDMFNEDSDKSKNGVLAVGVPGELKGYWDAHQRYGRLTWEEVIMPTISICEEGYIMSKHQSDSLDIRAEYIHKDPILREVFVNPKTGKFFRPGERIRPKKFCETLKIIAKNGGNCLYNGSLAKVFVSDIQEMGGIITEEDMASYRVKWDEPITVNLQDKMTLFSTPPPGSGILLGFVLNILDGYNFTSESIRDTNSTILTYHRIIEAFKFAYARRTELGDGDFVNITYLLHTLESKDYGNKIRESIDDNRTYTDPGYYGAVNYSVDDHGTAHVSIIAPNGDAASITSTVNIYFGAGVTSHRTGIILNSGMNDFSIPKAKSYFGIPFSSANSITPGKHAVSSMCPSVIVNGNGDVRLVIGGSGGTKITTAVAFVIMRILWFGEGIKQAVDASRIHHQIFPMEVAYDYGVLDQIVKGLEKLGHKTDRIRDRGSIICALFKLGNMITANADFRKGGDVFGID
ncbi:gamma-glutamyltranspeptidase 1-like isoform X2 [Zootermopsis nevadensis]|uniref:gamma-glutamyltranspeptidase 1-like isoform X2 n=1 Tax=Zootermopsis nevadensis TaxID=136037 RepID=UPI000B8E79F5|nr:gamma-glutamyltranspeptidase 1-like isoform X2 [Zootermopsis nevadensis]XP_021926881.1 gamma-glutamyltranspeptidase 1-like isoform X2 [Zootermopsis nevadensis]